MLACDLSSSFDILKKNAFCNALNCNVDVYQDIKPKLFKIYVNG